MIISGSSIDIVNSSFYANKANSYGGTLYTIDCSIHVTDCSFDHNLGSLYIFNSNLTFSGYTKLENCMESLNKQIKEMHSFNLIQKEGQSQAFSPL